ncbi:SEC-C domain-containing protein [bacterium]|nr:SEC-C domain-containing protein [bacterium]
MYRITKSGKKYKRCCGR